MKPLRRLLPVVALLALASCGSFPRAEFRISAFGFEIAADTRKLTDDIGDVSASMVRAVGVEPPVLDTSACTADGAECGPPK